MWMWMSQRTPVGLGCVAGIGPAPTVTQQLHQLYLTSCLLKTVKIGWVVAKNTNESRRKMTSEEQAEDPTPTPAKDAKDTKDTKDARDSPAKRKSSEGPENGESKKKRRKVNHACVYCRRSHMTCDLERPCARCIKRDIGHLCHDEPRDPPKRNKSEVGVADIAPAPGEGGKAAEAPTSNTSNTSNGGVQYAQSNGNGNGIGMGTVNGAGGGPQLAQPQPVSPTSIQRPAPNATNLLQNDDFSNSGVHNQFQDMHHLHPNYMFNTSEVTNEYNLLNDFLSSSLIDDGGIYNSDETAALFNDPLLTTISSNALATSNIGAPSTSNDQNQSTLLPPPQTAAGQEISRPSSTFPIDSRARDKFYMTAADPAGLESAENRLHKLLKAKYDAGMLKPFNYVKGYARLNQYISKHLNRESQLRILKQLDRFRPKFREAMQSLTDMQLILVEMWFERSLMEYDRVFASMAIPACCWRRTGEIFRGNTEMAELIHVPLDKLRDGKLAIHEIIAEDSLVSYWEKFGAIAFDQSQKAILTSCSIKRPGHDGDGGEGERAESVRCCFSFTIRRDGHNIPSLIVGNFLPIRPHGQSPS
ncbi:Regulator of drug sensitivity 2 [Lecanosticta acicola]|uniref:Regulator of drug sensitivity 2 n=1 Tax=Lecanosticta acicola TaxID=111012 RepID=A0AAI8W1Q5_9PEZI|nr:Regulator of drug sensitivity 2 [Lecanosticta acicola]